MDIISTTKYQHVTILQPFPQSVHGVLALSFESTHMTKKETRHYLSPGVWQQGWSSSLAQPLKAQMHAEWHHTRVMGKD